MSTLSDEQVTRYKQARLHIQCMLDEILRAVRMVSKKSRNAR